MNTPKYPLVYTFIIGGTIGAGKSELSKRLAHVFADKARFPRVKYVSVTEPVDVWQSSHLLELFISNQTEWSGLFQIITFTTRLARWSHVYKHEIEPLLCDTSLDVILVSLERSHFCDKNVFVDMLVADSKIAPSEKLAYDTLFDTFKSRAPPTPISAMVWIETGFDETLRRKNIRSRVGEDDYNTTYLRKLCVRHATLMDKGWYALDADASVPVLKFDGNSNFNTQDSHVLKLANELVAVALGRGEIAGLKYQDKAAVVQN